jgi:hypothetical protein
MKPSVTLVDSSQGPVFLPYLGGRQGSGQA